MPATKYNKIILRILPLFMGLFLSTALYTPGYCLDPPVVTPIHEFFIEHNGGDVQIAPPDWQLIVDGLVARPLALTIEEVRDYPSQTHMATIECGGNPFAFKVADLIGNAVWTGVPVSTLLNYAGPLDTAASVTFTALDGYTVRIGLEDLYERDDIMLAYGMNGETLPPEQGYPLRLIFPGISGNVWVQWVTHVEVTSTQMTGTFWPLPPHCQIFEPVHEQTIDLGTRRIYGMALAGGVEITAVEVSTDGGFSWQPATILTEYVPNAWRHWEFNWTPPAPGNYMLAARAIDASGKVQAEPGIYGWKMLSIALMAEGPDACVNGAPCESGLYCDEFADTCVECLNDDHCGEGQYCDETTDTCVECLTDDHCEDLYICENTICVEGCTLTIINNVVLSEKLFKPRKVTLTITGGEDFDPYGTIDLGPLDVLKPLFKTKMNALKIRALVPAGLEPRIIPIRVGDCVGEIEIR
jgi:sulfane dehydrogenase subunit SoxC